MNLNAIFNIFGFVRKIPCKAYTLIYDDKKQKRIISFPPPLKESAFLFFISVLEF